jgi:hypothetical protein
MSNVDPTISTDVTAAIAAALPDAPTAADPNVALAETPELDTAGLDAIPVDIKAWLDRNAPKLMGDDFNDTAPASSPAPTAPVAAADDASSLAPASLPPAEGTTTAAPTAPVPGEEVPPPTDDDAPADEPLPTAASIKLNYGGSDLELNTDQVGELLATYSWVTDPARQQLFQVTAAIESGQAVALSRDDYDALIAAAQKATTPAPAPAPAAPSIPRVDPNSTLDPDLARAFNALADVVAQQQAAAPVAPSAVPPTVDIPAGAPLFDPAVARQQAELEERRTSLLAIHDTYAQRYGLTPTEAERLIDVATRSGDVARMAQQHAQTAPHLPFNVEAAFSLAFDRALVSDPSLRARYEATLRSAPAPASVAAAPAPAPSPVAAKKANAGSLSSLASAATPALNRDPRQMSEQDVTAAITAELQAALGVR